MGKEDPFKLSNVKYLCKIRLALKFEPPRGCGYLYIYAHREREKIRQDKIK